MLILTRFCWLWWLVLLNEAVGAYSCTPLPTHLSHFDLKLLSPRGAERKIEVLWQLPKQQMLTPKQQMLAPKQQMRTPKQQMRTPK
ncbi:hypothetical protein H6H01_25780 [Nostoc calcicola FACHB-3891]|nr:hypothetical protein [Nostoc calcicola FACHB-3891]